MRELLILPLFAFLLHCSWVETIPDNINDINECMKLSGDVSFDRVKECTKLGTKSGEKMATVTIGKVDENEWNRFASNLEKFYWIYFRIQNSNIKTINFPNLQSARSSTILFVQNNPLLEDFSLSAGGSDWTSFYDFDFRDNPKLKSVKIKNIQSGIFQVDGGSLRFINNKALEMVDFPNNAVVSFHTFHIKGNPLLKKDSLDYFKHVNLKVPDKYIQDEGECIFDYEISDLEELKFCKYINGDLKIAKGAKGSAGSTVLSKVTGIVYLNDPKVEQLDFLKGTTVDGQINCQFDDEVTNLGVFTLCTVMTSDLKISANVNGLVGNSARAKVTGTVYLKDPKREQLGFLKGTSVTGPIVCSFDNEVTDVTIFDLCQKVEGDLKLAASVNGTVNNPTDINGNVYLKDPPMNLTDFLNGTTISGHIVCHFDKEVVDLAVFKLCPKVEGDLKLAPDVNGIVDNSVLVSVDGDIHLKDPKMDKLDFLNGTNITGHFVCHFTKEITKLPISRLCQKVDGDLMLSSSIDGTSSGNNSLISVNGNVDFKDAKEDQLGFLNGTNVTGEIESWCLSSLHGNKITKKGTCPSDDIFNKPWMITLLVGSGVVLLIVLIGAGIFVYLYYWNKKSKLCEIVEKEPKKAKILPVPHVPLKLTAVDTIYDPIPLTGEESKKRLGLLVQHILMFNPLEYLQIAGRLKVSYYLPDTVDTRGEPMKKEYADLLTKYKKWQPSMPVVPVPAVYQDRANGSFNPDKEKQKLWNTVLRQKGKKKVALCLWSHDDLDSIYPTLLPFFTEENKKEKEEIKKEFGEKESKRKKSGRVKKKSTAIKSGPTTTTATISREQPPEAATTTPTAAENVPVKFIFTVGKTQVYMDYFHKKYQPAGKVDEGMATVFPFYVMQKSKNWIRQQLSFVVASAWPMKSLGEDKFLTFRALHWARKQLPKRKVYVLTDGDGHKEECAQIAQCLYDSIMETSRPPITFLGACRLITARKRRSWDNGNMLLFLQRNLLFWAVDAGILKSDDARLINWDNIYRCMVARSRATPSVRIYDPDNLPTPPDLWPLEFNDENRMKAPPITMKDEDAKEPHGIWRCDLGRAKPPALTTAGRLGAEEPAKFIDKPIGFEAAWGRDSLRDGGAQEEGNTTTLASDHGLHKKRRNPEVDQRTFDDLKKASQRILATSANAKKNKRGIRQLPKRIYVDGGLSERAHRTINKPKYDGHEFQGFRLASDIDHFVYVAPMKDSEFIRPLPRSYKWRKLDESRFKD